MNKETMAKKDIYCVEHLLRYLGDRPSTTDGGKEVPQTYEGDKPITLIDAVSWQNGMGDEAVLETFHNGDFIHYGWRELDIDDFDDSGDTVTAWVFTRRCSECGALMFEGFCVDNGWEYYCSDECLHKHFTEEEWDEMCCDGEGDSYWTQWY